MPQVEIVTKRGEKLGVIDDEQQTIEMTEAWKKRFAKTQQTKDTHPNERDVERRADADA